MKFLEKSIDLKDQKLTLQFGKLANASHVSTYARLGDTSVLVTLNISSASEEIDYLPLQVEYAEKLYAGGRIKGSRWVKREGRASDDAVLTARLIDRAIRPLFPKSLRKTIQIIITLLSVDGVNSPEMLASIATSAVIHASALPWKGPISTTRVGYIVNEAGEGSYIVSPKENEREFSVMDLVVSSTRDKVVMIETQAEQLPEKVVIEGIKLAKAENGKIIEMIEEIRREIGHPKMELVDKGNDAKIEQILKSDFKKEVDAMLKAKAEKESDNKAALDELVGQIAEKYKGDQVLDKKAIAKAIDYLAKQSMRETILKDKKRVDGRGPDDIRPISCEVGILPRTHGTGLFQRGDTQVLSIVTLGSPSLEQLIESPEGEEAKHYIHHYFMPPYSVGETGRVGFPSRREIGHGALAEKAVEPVLPPKKDFPYTIRVASEVLSSNGSTSMASTCGSILSLMDAGVPIKSPVSGIAMGLVQKDEKNYVILTDIMGIEDFGGDMDFKMAGSAVGLTAIQLDVKTDGLSDAQIEEAMEKGRKARLFILDKMVAVMPKPRHELSKFAPKVMIVIPPADKIGEIIGPGGRNIRNLIAMTGTDINVSNDGKVSISGFDKAKVEEAATHIENMVREIEVGTEFEGEVKRMLPFGAFVEILPGKEGLVHVSKMGKGFIKDPSQVVNLGDRVKVRVYQIDQQNRINLELISGGTGTGESTMPPQEGGMGGGRPPRRFDRGSGGPSRGGQGGYGRRDDHRGGHGGSPNSGAGSAPPGGSRPPRRPRIDIE